MLDDWMMDDWLQKIAPRGCSNRSNYRSAHDEETAYDSYMNPEPGFRAGPGDSYAAA